MVRFMKMLGGLLLASTLAACGGGGGSAGETPGGGGGTPTNPGAPAVASLIYQLAKPSLNNSGGDTTLLTVTALDANNNPIPTVPVTVSVDSGVYTPNTSTTDTAGQVSGTIGIGANKANRSITVTISAGAQRSTATVTVAGSAIGITPVPATPTPSAAVRFDVRVTDSTGAGVAGVPVQLSGTLGLTGTVTTDNTGNAVANLAAAPATPGTYTVDATALGVTQSRTVQVAGGTSSGIPAVTENVSAASLSIVPNTVSPNTAGSTANRAVMRAKFLNGSNQAIRNVRVRFNVRAPALGSGEQISTGSAVVYSDVNGEAIADYIPGTRSSPTEGVTIDACYGPTDASIANGQCPNFVSARLTVASQPLSITLGDNNELIRGANNLTYIKRFDIAVADAAGNAVPNAVISASVDITEYSKGPFAPTPPPAAGQPEPPIDTYRRICPNEDINRNGFLDTNLVLPNGQVVNEDADRDNVLEPRKADVILSFLGANTTGTNGRMAIQVEYPMNVATWLNYTVRVTTNVAGSEGSVSKDYITSFIEGDETNGSFLRAPYGSTLSCTAH